MNEPTDRRPPSATAILTSWQKPLQRAYESGQQIILESRSTGKGQRCRTLFTDLMRRTPGGDANPDNAPDPPTASPFRRAIGHLARIKAIVVGVDLREYSRREAEVQLLLTVALEASMAKTINALRLGGLLPGNEPRIVESTGDGSYLVFTSLNDYPSSDPDAWQTQGPETGASQDIRQQWSRDKEHIEDSGFARLVDHAMSFVFGLNALLGSDNAREAFRSEDAAQTGSGVAAHPVECRFAVSYDDVLLRWSLTQPAKLSCSGTGIVTCSRILSRDHGNHLLVHDALLRKLESRGGLSSICRGMWGHRLHGALLKDTVVKTGTYRFADLFGFYNDGPLLRALGWGHERPNQCHIGSHDLGSVDGG